MNKLKDYITLNLIKGLVATFIFQIAYIFTYSLLLRNIQPLAIIHKSGYPVLYAVVCILIGSVPYILCGFIIMLARNNYDNLREKNIQLAIAIFTVMFSFYTVLTILQAIFQYRDMYSIYISFNYPLLRSLTFLDINNLTKNLLILLTTFTVPFFIYVGGKLRLKTIVSSDIDG